MQYASDDAKLLQSAEGYALLGLYQQANQELECMSRETRAHPEVLALKLAIFRALNLWELVEIAAFQLARSAAGNPRWTPLVEAARRASRLQSGTRLSIPGRPATRLAAA